MNLIDDLLGAGGRRDLAAGSFHLGDEEGTVLRNLDEREAEMAHALHVLLSGIRVVAAGCLAAALQEVTHHRALAELVPVLHGPAELIDRGRHEDGGIGDAARDDHIRTLFQRLDDALGTHVGVCGNDLSGQLRKRLVCFPDFGIAVLVNHGKQVVAGDAGDLHAVQAVLLCDLHALLRARFRIGAAHVGDELDLVLPAQRQGLFHAVLQQAVIALVRIL